MGRAAADHPDGTGTKTPAEDYLSVHQVAQWLGCSVSLVQKWRRAGWLPATRLGTADVPVYGYRPSDVDRFVAERWNRRRGRPPRSPSAATDRAASPRSQPAATDRTVPPQAPIPLPPLGEPTGLPLLLWDADPRRGAAVVLARFQPNEAAMARAVAAAWATRYAELALGEPAAAGQTPNVLALWRGGRPVP
jgi:hypothetical protein